MNASQLTDSQVQVIADLASAIGTDSASLAAVIEAESSFNPTVINSTGHAGLIQISTANVAALGYGTPQNMVANYPDIESQIPGPVLSYFQWAINTYGAIRSFQDLSMAVYKPAYIGSTSASLPADCVAQLNVYSAHLSDTTSVSWPISGGSIPRVSTGFPWMEVAIIAGVLIAAGGLYFYLNRKK